MQPAYRGINKKTNGLYNTMGRQSKPPLMLGYSLDSNMNSSLSNRNHQFSSFDNNSIDFQSVVSMEILENGIRGSEERRGYDMATILKQISKS
ncbi:hypothetical protein NQ318_000124 [Aromia moschata]|uniref:Uncharacterized protein n=1 Tax=Aromia moschata TaxID=1265417 RepID=A0AAV8X105_9CUCU|nr:hypothetical protein NQ318_000124 [Aromia moschata]